MPWYLVLTHIFNQLSSAGGARVFSLRFNDDEIRLDVLGAAVPVRVVGFSGPKKLLLSIFSRDLEV